jgi:aminopeptidase N
MKFLRYSPLVLLLLACRTGIAQNTAIDVQHYRFAITLNDTNNIIQGKATIEFIAKKAANMVYFDLTGLNGVTGKGMKVLRVSENNRNLRYSQDSTHLNIYFSESFPVNVRKEVDIKYAGVPDDGLIISRNKFKRRTFFADNWPMRAHHWIPCNDYPSDKASVDFVITAPDHYQVVANGILVEETNLAHHVRLSHWRTTVQLPTKVMAIGVADFAVQRVATIRGVPIWTWVFTANRDSGFAQYTVAKEILPFYMNYIGPYPYRKLANVQSKTRFGGLENASNIFYSQNSVVLNNSDLTKNHTPIEALMAHEIAHQWFGDAVTETGWQHLWLSEGFATYMTDLYFENKYGEDSLRARMRRDRVAVLKFYKKRQTPVVDTSAMNDPMKLLNPNTYQKGSWVLHMLRRKLGDRVFQKGIRDYYTTYKGKNASTGDFRQIMEKASGWDLRPFFKQWLYSLGQPMLQGYWKYDPGKKIVAVTINQTQDSLFQFPLELAIQGSGDTTLKTINILNRKISIVIPVIFKPTSVILDPHVNLLFGGNLVEGK